MIFSEIGDLLDSTDFFGIYSEKDNFPGKDVITGFLSFKQPPV